jgi:hypothetical protein
MCPVSLGTRAEQSAILTTPPAEVISISDTVRTTPWIKLLINPAIAAAATCRVLSTFGGLVLQTKLPAYLENVLHLSATQNGLSNSYLFLSFMILLVVGPYLSEIMITKNLLSRTNTRKLFTSLANIGMIAGFVLFPFAECDATLVNAVLIISNAFHGLAFAGDVIVPSEMSLHYSSTIYAGINMMTSIPGFLAPLIIGSMLEGADKLVRLVRQASISSIDGTVFSSYQLVWYHLELSHSSASGLRIVKNLT